jgi:hypothetical protein
MLQRIQSLYLLIGLVLFVLVFCFPLGYITPKGLEQLPMTTFGIIVHGEVHYTFTLLFILILSVICEVVALFLYKNRVLQMRMIVFNCVLQVGFYIAIVSYIFIYKSVLSASFSLNWALLLPIITIVINIFAYKAIHKDEALIRSLNHLR